MTDDDKAGIGVVRISVLSFNVLAERYLHDLVPERYPHLLGPDAPPMDWPRRRARLLEQITGPDADIVCLEVELASAAADFGDALNAAGYAYVRHEIETKRKKGRTSPIGNLLAYRTTAFEMVAHSQSSRVLEATLRCRGGSGLVLRVWAAHLQARQAPGFAEERVRQLGAKRLGSVARDGGEWRADLVVGDLNDYRDSKVAQLLVDQGFRKAASALEPPVPRETCYVWRDEEHCYHEFDHVYVRSSDPVRSRCEILRPGGPPHLRPIPDAENASDHWPILAELTFERGPRQSS